MELFEGLLLNVPIPPLLVLFPVLQKLRWEESVNSDIVEFILGDLLKVVFSMVASWRLLGGSLIFCSDFEELLLLFAKFLFFISNS